MEKTKKLVSLLLALAMIFAMSLSVFAAGTNSIKVTNAQGGETYKIYKMLDADVNPEKTAYSYTLPAGSKWESFFTGSGAGAAYVDINIVDGTKYVTWKDNKNTASDYEAFGKEAAAYAATAANGVPLAATQTPAADGEFTFDGLDSGYYLITSTNGTLSMVETTPLKNTVIVNEKNPDPTIKKEVEEGSSFGTNNSAQIGDTVNFKVTINVRKGAKNYVMHDKMEDGLTFNKGSVQIDSLEKGTHYTVNTPAGGAAALADDCTFEISFTADYLNSITADTTLTVTYSAVLNEKADVTAGEENKVQLNWLDNNHTVWGMTTTKTYQFEILKYDAADKVNKKPLAGAKFQLKDDTDTVLKLVKESDTVYRIATNTETGTIDTIETVAAGNIVVKGVDLATYTLVETESPEGYAKLSAPKEFEVIESNTTLIVEVENTAGHTLPSTGGMGTTLFYVVGGILVIGAAAILILRKRTSDNK